MEGFGSAYGQILHYYLSDDRITSVYLARRLRILCGRRVAVTSLTGHFSHYR